MSELIKESSFSAYYKWQRLDRLGRPVNQTGFTQPDTLKINHTVSEGREQSAYIVPDQGINGPEWALCYTIPGFKENLLTRFSLTNSAIYSTFAKCLQGKAKSTWEELMVDEFPDDTGRTTAAFDGALRRYLEKIACCENMKDNVLRWLQTWRKPFEMDPVDYITRRKQLHRYATGNYLQGTLADVPEQAQKDEAFLGMPKTHKMDVYLGGTQGFLQSL